jgi:DNA-binding beta-propeller fold protein YncE
VALDSGGNLYVADSGNNTIRKITSAGVVSTIAGGSVGYADGVGNAAQFNNPDGIVANGNGIFVAIPGIVPFGGLHHALIFVPPGSFVTTWTVTTIVGGTFGTADGTGTNAQFLFPTALATDSANNLYVADQGGGIRKIIQVGTNWVVSTIPSAIYSDGIAVDSEGDIYMPDINNDTINKFTTIRRQLDSERHWWISDEFRQRRWSRQCRTF